MLEYIVWNPSEIIFEIGSFGIRWYSILFASGFVFSYLILKNHFKKHGVPLEKLEKLTIYVAVATILGARLGHCFFYDWAYYQHNLLEILLPFRFSPQFEFTGFQGLASHGGAIGILLAIFFYSKNQKMPVFWVLDSLGLVVPLAAMFIRLGNLMNSEIIGSPASVPWAFVFERVDDIPRHPGQLYEALSYLLIFIVLYFTNKSVKKEQGFIFGLFLILLFTARFILEFFKDIQSDFEADMMFNMGQILSVPFVLLGIYLVIKKGKTVQ
jgi:phosphatidylglycerol---prolipoprotein diacylglyceryl transferase